MVDISVIWLATIIFINYMSWKLTKSLPSCSSRTNIINRTKKTFGKRRTTFNVIIYLLFNPFQNLRTYSWYHSQQLFKLCCNQAKEYRVLNITAKLEIINIYSLHDKLFVKLCKPNLSSKNSLRHLRQILCILNEN